MDKINFVNNSQPAINDANLNLMQDNIENAKQDKFIKIVDSHGWTVLNFGTHKEFLKKVSINGTISGNGWKEFHISNLPTELTTIGDAVLTTSVRPHDPAVAINVGCSNDDATSISASCQNKYGSNVPLVASVNLRIIKIV